MSASWRLRPKREGVDDVTNEQRLAKVREIEVRVRDGLWTAEQGVAALNELDATPTTPSKGVVRETDREIAAALLREQGVSDAEGWKRLALNPDAEIASLGDEFERRKATLQNRADERARREFEQTPEGRRLRAAELADEAAARERDAALADRLLRFERRVPEDVIEQMPADEKIALAFHSTPDTSPIAAAVSKYSREPSATVSDDDPDANLRAAGWNREEE